jgi:hypothetical protein
MLKLEDIKVGMRVNTQDLIEIYDVVIILTDIKDHVGKIIYIGEPDTDELENIYKGVDNVCPIFNRSEDLEVDWDE